LFFALPHSKVSGFSSSAPLKAQASEGDSIFFRRGPTEPHVARRSIWRFHHPQLPNASCLPEGLRAAGAAHSEGAESGAVRCHAFMGRY